MPAHRHTSKRSSIRHSPAKKPPTSNVFVIRDSDNDDDYPNSDFDDFEDSTNRDNGDIPLFAHVIVIMDSDDDNMDSDLEDDTDKDNGVTPSSAHVIIIMDSDDDNMDSDLEDDTDRNNGVTPSCGGVGTDGRITSGEVLDVREQLHEDH